MKDGGNTPVSSSWFNYLPNQIKKLVAGYIRPKQTSLTFFINLFQECCLHLSSYMVTRLFTIYLLFSSLNSSASTQDQSDQSHVYCGHMLFIPVSQKIEQTLKINFYNTLIDFTRANMYKVSWIAHLKYKIKCWHTILKSFFKSLLPTIINTM